MSISKFFLPLFTVAVVFIFLFSPQVFAQTGGSGSITGGTGNGIELENPLGVSNITALIDAIIDFLITVGGALVAIIVIVGGYQILFAAGDPQKFATGKKTIIYAVVGYGIIWLSRGVVFLIQNVLQ